jgi:hypothetical protein
MPTARSNIPTTDKGIDELNTMHNVPNIDINRAMAAVLSPPYESAILPVHALVMEVTIE